MGVRTLEVHSKGDKCFVFHSLSKKSGGGAADNFAPKNGAVLLTVGN